MGYNSVKAQLMTVIIYGCAVVTVVFWGYTSDRTNQRSIPIMISSLIMATGYIINLATKSMKPRFIACILMAMGGYPVMLLQLMWVVINTISYTKRAVGLVVYMICAQLFGIIGSQASRDPPLYTKGHLFALGATLPNFVATLTCFVLSEEGERYKEAETRGPCTQREG